ncbi:MAG: chemotaxis protein CheW [Alphaproteobacteria bacterium]|jgi:purine-binding chemotaxis protein CheW|nr:chemotaxis protein CheW [Alphaproteobacteria bacterium]
MVDLLLIVRLAGRRVAVPASDVEAVVELEGLTAVPGAPDHIAGLSALRSRVLTVIDSWAALGLEDIATVGSTEAIVVPSGGHTYALLVEQVDDVVEASGPATPLKASPGPGWSRVSSGMIEVGDDLLLLIDPHALIAGPPLEEAA